jgi:plastocyanin
LGELQKSLTNGKLTYKAVGFWNKIKFSMVSMFVKMTGGLADNYEAVEVKEESSVKIEGNEGVVGDTVSDVDNQEESVEEPKGEEITEPTLEEEESVEETDDGSQEESESTTNNEETTEEVEENKDKVVEITNDGFSPDVLTIKVGETVVWKNVRNGNFKKSMIVGAQKCTKVRSDFYLPGEEFSWTFTEPLKCTFVDGMVTTQTMKLTIE